MPTGQEIHERIFENYGALGFIGTTTALAAATNRLRDATRLGMDTLSTEEYSDGFLRITSTSNSDAGLEAKIKWLDPTLGDLYFDPDAGAAIVSGATYEILRHGLRFDDLLRARDRALTTKCAPWFTKPLSVLKEVSDWSVAAYSGSAGGEQDSAGVSTALDFPNEIFAKSMVITNSAANGNIASESWYVQPTWVMQIWGRVSARSGTAAVRLRDITNGADITLEETSTFTLRGRRWFHNTATIPTGCGEVQLWLGGQEATAVTEWDGVGMIPDHETVYSHESRVYGKHDIAHYFGYSIPTEVRGRLQRSPIHGVNRERAGDGVMAIFDCPPAGPVYYRERHRYAALQSAYMTAANRETGDAASTDCNIDYIAAATVVELLQGRKLSDDLKIVLGQAMRDLRTWDRRVGADPLAVFETKNQSRLAVPRL